MAPLARLRRIPHVVQAVSTLRRTRCWLLSALIVGIVVSGAQGLERMKNGMAEVNGTSLYYEVAGKGFPLVLISGGGVLDRRGWDNQFETFAQHYKVIRYDIRGLGKSARPSKPFSHSSDLYALLKYLKVTKAHIVGLSFGGAIAIDFALEHPEMVSSLVLASTATSDNSKSKENVDSLLALTAMTKRDGLAKTSQFVTELPFVISQENAAAKEKIRQIYLDNSDLFESGFTLVTLWMPAEPPAQSRLSEIRAPTLVLLGENDHPSYKSLSDTLAAGITGAKKVVIPGGTHLLHLDKPEAFNRVVLEFLRK